MPRHVAEDTELTADVSIKFPAGTTGTITGLPDPTADTDADTKGARNTAIPLVSGWTRTEGSGGDGVLAPTTAGDEVNMGLAKITNLDDPTADTDADTKGARNTAIGKIVLSGTPADTDYTGVATDTYASGYSSAAMDLVFLGSGGKWLEVDANAVATCNGLMGIAMEAKTDTNPMLVALPGSFVRNETWTWTVGVTLYAGETAGAMQEVIPTGADAIIKVVGFAVTAKIIFFNPSPDQQSTVA